MADTGPCFTVVLVGDDAFRERAEPMLERDSLLVIGSVPPDQAIATAVGRSPDVVVIADPAGDGGPSTSAIASEIGSALPATRVLVVATQGKLVSDPSELVDSWVGGVIGLDSPPTLADAVECLALGEGLVDAALATVVMDRHRSGDSPFSLTATEEEVVSRIAEGADVDTLASEYAVTPRLVRQHAGGALARLHPRS